MNDTIAVRLEQGDALMTEADAVAVQYPQRLYRLVDRVVKILAEAHRPIVLLPKKDAVRLLDRVDGIVASRILLVGTAHVHEYDYRDLRLFACRAITHLASIREVRDIALPAYGPPGYRLDDTKSFEAEIEGIVEAVQATAVRDAVETVTLVEPDANRAARLWRLLSDGLVQDIVGRQREALDTPVKESSATTEPAVTATAERAQPQALFLCYRREDTEDAAGRYMTNSQWHSVPPECSWTSTVCL